MLKDVFNKHFAEICQELIIAIYVTWLLHFTGFVCSMMETCMKGSAVSWLPYTWLSRSQGASLKSGVPCSCVHRAMTSGDPGELPALTDPLVTSANINQPNGRNLFLWQFSEVLANTPGAGGSAILKLHTMERLKPTQTQALLLAI